MKQGKFLNNTSWLVGGQIVRLIISFCVNTLTMRFLGPSNYGVITYIASYIAFFTAVIGMGFSGIIIYELVTHPDENGKILGTAILARFAVGIVCTLALFGVVLLMDGPDPLILAVTAAQAAQLPFLCLDTLNYWYQSNLQSKYAVIVQMIAYVVTSAYKIFLLVTGKSVIWFAFATSIDIIMISVLYAALYQKHKVQKLAFSESVARRMLKSCGPFVIANLLSVIYSQMDRVMLKQMLGTTEVGLYSAAITICQLISFIPISVLESARPLIVAAKERSEEEYVLRFRQLCAALLWICGLYSLGVTLLAKLIVFILYGVDYLNCVTCLRLGVWFTMFSYVGSAFHLWLICEKKGGYVVKLCACGAVINLLMNWLLIPAWGINGAAVATLFTQIATNLLIPLCLKDTNAYGKQVLRALLLQNIELDMLTMRIKEKFARNKE